mmetsp:Transcript_100900/g.177646  ORF Transcript_100900/g.177646 Transcript_100900/m.177646 type:complete len:200 (+) Transcript_100900:62-661(+)
MMERLGVQGAAHPGFQMAAPQMPSSPPLLGCPSHQWQEWLSKSQTGARASPSTPSRTPVHLHLQMLFWQHPVASRSQALMVRCSHFGGPRGQVSVATADATFATAAGQPDQNSPACSLPEHLTARCKLSEVSAPKKLLVSQPESALPSCRATGLRESARQGSDLPASGLPVYVMVSSQLVSGWLVQLESCLQKLQHKSC